VFDLLSLDGKDLRPLPLVKRKQRLGRFLTGRHPRLFEVEHIEKDGVAMFAGAMALGLEGIVAKDAKSPYVEGSADRALAKNQKLRLQTTGESRR